MIFIPTEFLNPGMMLARDLNLQLMHIPLLTSGQILTKNYIQKLKESNLSGVYIDNSISDDVEIKELITTKLKTRALNDIKTVFDDYSKNNEITSYNITAIANLAKTLVTEILSKDELVINLTELKGYDDYTYRHCLCVALLSISIGIKLGFTYNMLTELSISALLHDLGKMDIPLEILNKHSALTNDELKIIKKHPVFAYEQLKNSNMLSYEELSAIVGHHEKYNGSGYPYGLKGTDIHIYGRILAIADVYDAITSDRPYRSACFPNEAIEYMMGCSGTHFDHDILISFLKIVAAYPDGTIVLLSNGQKALVISNHEENTLRPLVKIFDKNGNSSFIDLYNDPKYYNITIAGMGYDENINYEKIRNSGI